MVSVSSMTKKWTKPTTVAPRVLAKETGSAVSPMSSRKLDRMPPSESTRSQL
jgi:hypothetical protein